mmetsp:Transcript_23311/g.57202  ORF Transcript_23311/g.57202 Transcript_23311/m.57202 type:complete len:260 (+) Transcript_23311:159-938(+)|eukprot:CAMPEP_0197600170 /NCGR_PEP_ID=MMETSP1326-20131121/32768_1 /TAXON_ID=1155430 /ORGANISM="Genus nov. species nov., Strain RCC2288" /LENGTH=259 /DNA_ID=CAMNT_0043167231 /DNA_START=137 /DNA_END=916 /DNA_ORIENTATION=-
MASLTAQIAAASSDSSVFWLETIGHAMSAFDIATDVYLAYRFLNSSDPVLHYCGIASACFLTLSVAANCVFFIPRATPRAFTVTMIENIEEGDRNPLDRTVYRLLFLPLTVLHILFLLFVAICTNAAVKHGPIKVLLCWPLLVVCAVDALTNPTGLLAYQKYGYLPRNEENTQSTKEDIHKSNIAASIYFCCLEDVPEIIIIGVSTITAQTTVADKTWIYLSLTFSVYRLVFDGLRKHFQNEGLIKIGDVQSVVARAKV